MKVRTSFGVIIVVALFAGAAQGQEQKQEFLKYGDVISGHIRAVNTKHSNGAPVAGYQIVSDAPKKVADKEALCKAATPKTFQLAETDNKAKSIRLKRSAGKKVDIVADAFTCSQLSARMGDAVVTKWRFTGPPER